MTSAVRMHRETGARRQAGAAQKRKWNFVAMGEAGLTGRTRDLARPVARVIARRTGRSEADILSLMGMAFLAMALIKFVHTVGSVIKAGRTGRQAADDPPANG